MPSDTGQKNERRQTLIPGIQTAAPTAARTQDALREIDLGQIGPVARARSTDSLGPVDISGELSD